MNVTSRFVTRSERQMQVQWSKEDFASVEAEIAEVFKTVKLKGLRRLEDANRKLQRAERYMDEAIILIRRAERLTAVPAA